MVGEVNYISSCLLSTPLTRAISLLVSPESSSQHSFRQSSSTESGLRHIDTPFFECETSSHPRFCHPRLWWYQCIQRHCRGRLCASTTKPSIIISNTSPGSWGCIILERDGMIPTGHPLERAWLSEEERTLPGKCYMPMRITGAYRFVSISLPFFQIC